MTVPVKVTGEIKGVEGLASYIKGVQEGLVTESMLEGIASKVKENIIKRTGEGRDFRSERFSPYSKEWKRKRAGSGKETAVVDLKFTGKMLAGIHSEAVKGKNEARLYFDDFAEGKKAAYHNVTGAGWSKVKREFFGLGAEDKKFIRGVLLDHIEKVLKVK